MASDPPSDSATTRRVRGVRRRDSSMWCPWSQTTLWTPPSITSATWIKHTCSRARSIALDVCPLLPRLSSAPILVETNLDTYVADSVESPNSELLVEQLADFRGVFEHLPGAQVGCHSTRDVGPSNTRREAMSPCVTDFSSPKARLGLNPGRFDLLVSSSSTGWQWARLCTTLALEVRRNAKSRRRRLGRNANSRCRRLAHEFSAS